MIGLLTDSSAQLTDELRARHAVEIVPMIITIDGVGYREGVDIDADGFFEAVEQGGSEVVTSQPSPGAFIEAYARLAAAGATEILAVLVGSAHSGTLNSARVAAVDSPLPVRLVDSGSLSFGVACCLLEAAVAIGNGADLEAAAAAAEATADRVATTFIVLPQAVSQRARLVAIPWAEQAQPVMLMAKDRLEVVGEAKTVDEICDLLVEPMLAEPAPIRAAVCVADPSAEDYWVGMEKRLRDAPNVAELLSYRVGPSVAAHTGRGTAGGYWHRLER
jgi:fatty acid-binding protein DegV